MANPWFRMYSEFSHDPKVQMLSEAMQRRYIMLMCLRCSNSLVTLQETEVAFHLRISNDEITETKALFISKGFIDSDWNLLNWEKRQFASDSSNARVAKHRSLSKAKQKNDGNADVTLQKHDGNALDTDTDTDTDKKRTPKAPKGGHGLFENFWIAYPKKDAKQKAREAFEKIKPDADLFQKMLASIAVQAKSPAWTKDKGQFIPMAATWLNGARWQDEPTKVANAANAGTDDFMRANKHAPWVLAAGFANIWEAHNNFCFEHTAHEFRDGKRLEVSV